MNRYQLHYSIEKNGTILCLIRDSSSGKIETNEKQKGIANIEAKKYGQVAIKAMAFISLDINQNPRKNELKKKITELKPESEAKVDVV